MSDSFLSYLTLIAVALAGGLYYLFTNKKSKPQESKPAILYAESKSLQLQAYERAILLVDRISIPNLISRNNINGISAIEMQQILTKNIREEFDYNITQQIYIDPECWEAIRNLKDSNTLLINQIASHLAPGASGLNLNKAILESLIKENKQNHADLVNKALSFEAKKLLS